MSESEIIENVAQMNAIINSKNPIWPDTEVARNVREFVSQYELNGKKQRIWDLCCR